MLLSASLEVTRKSFLKYRATCFISSTVCMTLVKGLDEEIRVLRTIAYIQAVETIYSRKSTSVRSGSESELTFVLACTIRVWTLDVAVVAGST